MRKSPVAALSLLLGALCAVLSVSAASATSYQLTNGSIVDPIQSVFGGDHSYSGNNLVPGATLNGANLNAADLTAADLTEAFLTSADLTRADLIIAKLTGADLSNAILTDALLNSANLTDAILTGANLVDALLNGAILTDAINLSSTTGDASYNANTDFTGTGFDPVAAGWIFLPEPSAAALQLAALLGMAWLRWRAGPNR